MLFLSVLLALLVGRVLRCVRNKRGRNPEWSFDLSVCNGEPRAEPMFDCRTIYTSMLGALSGARSEVVMEMYIIDDDWLGRRFERALSECISRGVRVRVLCDGYGCRRSRKTLVERLRRAGVEVSVYGRWWEPDCRNHRKILIVDDRVAFLGGVNIARRYVECWRDLCVRLEGEEIAPLRELFERDWRGRGGAEEVTRGWLFTEQHIEQLLCALIRSARRRLLISTPYFVPPPSVLTMIGDAVRRGVEVRLLLPSRGDSTIVGVANNAHIEPLFESGVGVWLYAEEFNHSKVVVADDVAVVGSANFDYRSMRCNREVVALLRSRECVRKITQNLGSLFAVATPLCLEEWRGRPLWSRVSEKLLRPIFPFL